MSSLDKPPTPTSTPSYLPSVALFGATGGCLLSTLVRLLNTPPPPASQATQKISVLVRSRSKLEALLAKKGISSEILSTPRLRIIEGDILTDLDKILETITLPPDNYSSTNNNKKFVDVILFGIGGYPRATLLPPFVTVDNPTLCQQAMSSILTALRHPTTTDKNPKTTNIITNKPLILAISSTGIYRGGLDDPRDLYLPMLLLYKLLLATPHKDKSIMEDLLTSAAEHEKDSPICEFIVIRGALFTDHPAEAKPLRAGYPNRVAGRGEGVRWGDVVGPAMGCSVSREDVGRWVWEEVASGRAGWSEEGEYVAEWKGKKVTLTN